MGLTLFAAACFAAGFFVFLGSLQRVETPPAEIGDGIVALTGGAQRIGDAIDLLATGYGRRLLITGVGERTHRDAIAKFNSAQRGIFDCCVDLDRRARNTIGNAVETRRWVREHGFGSLIVVTSNYHMPRSLMELKHVLPGVRLTPYAVVTGMAPEACWKSVSCSRVIAVEYAKFMVVWLRNAIEGDGQASGSGGSPS